MKIRIARRWVVAAVFALSIVLNALDRSLLAAVQPSLRRQFQINNAQYGDLVAAFSLVYGCSAPLMGFLLDRYGLTLVATSAVGLWSFASLMTGWAGSFPALLAWRAVLGFAESAGLPASGKAYAQLLRSEERSLGTATNQFGLALGSIGAILLAGWMTPRWGWQSSFLVAGPLGWLWIPLWISVARSAPLTPAVSQKLSGGAARVLRDRRLWALVTANLLTMPLYSLWTNWTTAYLVHERGLTESAANLQFAWIPPVLATLGGLAGGWMAMRRAALGIQRSRYLVCVWAAVGLLSTAAIPFLPSAGAATLGIGLSFFLTLAISVNVYAMPLDLYGPERSGLTFSLLTSVYGLMQAVVSPQIGRVVDRFGFAPICVVGAICPLSGVLVLRLARLNR
jgi:ACS family hexuronate transporter-like MFS transporter